MRHLNVNVIGGTGVGKTGIMWLLKNQLELLDYNVVIPHIETKREVSSMATFDDVASHYSYMFNSLNSLHIWLKETSTDGTNDDDYSTNRWDTEAKILINIIGPQRSGKTILKNCIYHSFFNSVAPGLNISLPYMGMKFLPKAEFFNELFSRKEANDTIIYLNEVIYNRPIKTLI